MSTISELNLMMEERNALIHLADIRRQQRLELERQVATLEHDARVTDTLLESERKNVESLYLANMELRQQLEEMKTGRVAG